MNQPNKRIFRPQMRIFAAFLTICLLFLSIGGDVFAAGGSCGSNAKWNLSGGTLTISGEGAMENYTEHNMAPWYGSRESITEVYIQEGITSIGDLAFYGCSSIQTVTIPSSVLTIGDMTYAGCKSLARVTLSEGLKFIGEHSFSRCEALTRIRFPGTLISIGNEAFYCCESLTSVRLPSTLASLGSAVFAYCTGLMQAVVDCPVSQLPRWTFYGCTSLVNVSLSSTIQTIGEYAFYECGALENAYHGGSESDREEIQDQIQNTVPGFSGVTQGTGSNLDSSSSSSSTQHGGGTVVETEKEVVETEDSSIHVTVNHTKPITGKEEYDVTIDADVETEKGFEDLLEQAGGYLEYPQRYEDEDTAVGQVQVNLHLNESSKLPSDFLQYIAGKEVKVSVFTGTGGSWEINGKDISKEEAKESYELDFSFEKNENPSGDRKKLIGDAACYELKFRETIDFPVTVKIPFGTSYAGHYATIYQKPPLKEWELLQSVFIDGQGIASFYLAAMDRHTDYMIAIDVEGISGHDLIVPDSMNEEYGMLMDADGNKYKLSGAESSWGISFFQMNLILFGVIAGSAFLVGMVVWVYHRNRQIKEKWQRIREKDGHGSTKDENAS